MTIRLSLNICQRLMIDTIQVIYYEACKSSSGSYLCGGTPLMFVLASSIFIFILILFFISIFTTFHCDIFLTGHSHREEYVQDDGGLMFRGVYNRIKPTPWNYAQYEKDILECALYLVREIGKVFNLKDR